MHDSARDYITRQVSRLGPFQSVLEVGSRNVNGGIRDLFPGSDYLGIDIADGPGVDIVVDASNGWTPPQRYALVVCCETFEHTARWPAIVANIAAWLAPSGICLLTMAGPRRAAHSGIDGGPVRAGEFYRNVRPEALSLAMQRVGLDAELDTTVFGDLYALGRRA